MTSWPVRSMSPASITWDTYGCSLGYTGLQPGVVRAAKLTDFSLLAYLPLALLLAAYYSEYLRLTTGWSRCHTRWLKRSPSHSQSSCASTRPSAEMMGEIRRT